jgi:hypothetical protein
MYQVRIRALLSALFDLIFLELNFQILLFDRRHACTFFVTPVIEIEPCGPLDESYELLDAHVRTLMTLSQVSLIDVNCWHLRKQMS